jgi:hypothetical protein
LKIYQEKPNDDLNDFLCLKYKPLENISRKADYLFNDYLIVKWKTLEDFLRKADYLFNDYLIVKWKPLQNISREADCWFQRLPMSEMKGTLSYFKKSWLLISTITQ